MRGRSGGDACASDSLATMKCSWRRSAVLGLAATLGMNSGCAARNRAHGDRALENGDFRHAAANYLVAVYDDQIQDPETLRRSKTRLAVAAGHVLSPALAEATELYHDGFTALAVHLAADLCAGEVYGGLPAGPEGLVPGSCELAVQAGLRLLGLEEGSDRPPLDIMLARFDSIAELFVLRPVPEALRAAVRRQIDRAAQLEPRGPMAGHTWLATRRFLDASGPDPDVQALMSRARRDLFVHQVERAHAVSSAQPGLSAVHALVASEVAEGDEVAPSSAGVQVALKPGTLTGPCSKTFGKWLKNEQAARSMTVDIELTRCAGSKETRYRTKKKHFQQIEVSTHTVSEADQKYRTIERCRRVRRCKTVLVTERYWTEFRGCHERDVVEERVCEDVRLADGFGPSRKRTFTVRHPVWRTKLVRQAYTVPKWTAVGRARATLDGRKLELPFSVETEASTDRRARHKALFRVLNSIRGAAGRIDEAQLANVDELERLARRALRGQLKAGDTGRLATALGLPFRVVRNLFSSEELDGSTRGLDRYTEELARFERDIDWKERWRVGKIRRTWRNRKSKLRPSVARKRKNRLPIITESYMPDGWSISLPQPLAPPSLLGKLQDIELDQATGDHSDARFSWRLRRQALLAPALPRLSR